MKYSNREIRDSRRNSANLLHTTRSAHSGQTAPSLTTQVSYDHFETNKRSQDGTHYYKNHRNYNPPPNHQAYIKPIRNQPRRFHQKSKHHKYNPAPKNRHSRSFRNRHHFSHKNKRKMHPRPFLHSPRTPFPKHFHLPQVSHPKTCHSHPLRKSCFQQCPHSNQSEHLTFDQSSRSRPFSPHLPRVPQTTFLCYLLHPR